jgi:hypothetical protein
MEPARDLSWGLGFQAEVEEAHTGFEEPCKMLFSGAGVRTGVRTVRTLAGAERRLDTSDVGGETPAFCGP